MASKTLPGEHIMFKDEGQAIQFGTGDDAIFIWPDPRGGVNVQGSNAIHLHQRGGTSVRVITGHDDYRRELARYNVTYNGK